LWEQASQYLERYVEAAPDDWEAQFSLGVAQANKRGGEESDRAALRAYDNAIVFVDEENQRQWLPRLYAYRGGMLKRLGRLAEAESSLLLAGQIASDRDDLLDIAYNLAGIYAQMGEADRAIEQLRILSGTPWMSSVHAHADDYFARIKSRPEFLELVRNI